MLLRGNLMFKIRVFSTVILSLWLMTTSAQATVAKALNFDELFKQSDIVVHGWVLDQWSEAPEGLPGIIYTHTIIEVATDFKGGVNKRIELRQIGGEIDGYTVRLSGTPHFELGGEVVVFAGRDDDLSPFASVGLSQGVFYVKREHDEVKLFRNLSGITFHNPVVRPFSKSPMPDRLPDLINEVFARWSDLILKEGE